ncbi:MAG: hypothetical protein ABI867_18285 [Kofleriaceae bacterium]
MKLSVLVLSLVACSAEDPESLSDASQAASGGPHEAVNVHYNACFTHLPASNVQQAIDVLAARPSTGVRGPDGARGPTGPIGPPGITGAPGTAGSAATTDVVLAGAACLLGGARFDAATGTSYACTAAAGTLGPVGSSGLAGPAGAIGEPGPDGVNGTTGTAGASGPRGPTGLAGSAGPAGNVPLAPLGWSAYSQFDQRFYGTRVEGLALVMVWTSRAGTYDSPVLFTLAPGQQFLQIVPGIDPTTSKPVVFELDGHNNFTALFTHDLPGGERPGNFPAPGQPVVLALANETSDGQWGGYAPAHPDFAFFGITQERALAFYTRDDPRLPAPQHNFRSQTLIANLPTTLASFGSLPECASGLGNLVHDPQSRRLLVADTCNGVIWVLGYDAPLGEITPRAILHPQQLGPLGYDDAHHILYSGTYGISIDLGTL